MKKSSNCATNQDLNDIANLNCILLPLISISGINFLLNLKVRIRSLFDNPINLAATSISTSDFCNI